MKQLATHPQEINMDQRLSTISDLMNEMGIEKATAKKVTENIKNYSISQNLTILRARANISQAEMAKKMNTSQSFISKLEGASNDQIKVDDMCAFFAALGYETTITISKPQKDARDEHLFFIFAGIFSLRRVHEREAPRAWSISFLCCGTPDRQA